MFLVLEERDLLLLTWLMSGCEYTNSQQWNVTDPTDRALNR